MHSLQQQTFYIFLTKRSKSNTITPSPTKPQKSSLFANAFLSYTPLQLLPFSILLSNQYFPTPATNKQKVIQKVQKLKNTNHFSRKLIHNKQYLQQKGIKQDPFLSSPQSPNLSPPIPPERFRQ